MNLFLKGVASVLEVDEVDLDLDFRTVPGWCSLQGFGLLVLLENDWGAPVSIDRFLGMKSVKDLYREAFLALAAKVFGVERAALRGDLGYGEIPEWSSVNHLKLVMEAEKRFGVSYPFERVPFLRRLDDFLVDS